MAFSHNFPVVMDGMVRRLDRLDRRALPVALPRALNRVAQNTRTLAVREVSDRMGLKRKPVRDAMKIIRARRGQLQATIRTTGRPLSLRHFDPTPASGGIAAKAWGKRKVYKGTFMRPLNPSGVQQVVKRVGPRRLPIGKLFGPGVPQTAADDAVLQIMRRNVSEKLVVELRRQLNFATKRT